MVEYKKSKTDKKTEINSVFGNKWKVKEIITYCL